MRNKRDFVIVGIVLQVPKLHYFRVLLGHYPVNLPLSFHSPYRTPFWYFQSVSAACSEIVPAASFWFVWYQSAPAGTGEGISENCSRLPHPLSQSTGLLQRNRYTRKCHHQPGGPVSRLPSIPFPYHGYLWAIPAVRGGFWHQADL